MSFNHIVTTVQILCISYINDIIIYAHWIIFYVMIRMTLPKYFDRRVFYFWVDHTHWYISIIALTLSKRKMNTEYKLRNATKLSLSYFQHNMLLTSLLCVYITAQCKKIVTFETKICLFEQNKKYNQSIISKTKLFLKR